MLWLSSRIGHSKGVTALPSQRASFNLQYGKIVWDVLSDVGFASLVTIVCSYLGIELIHTSSILAQLPARSIRLVAVTAVNTVCYRSLLWIPDSELFRLARFSLAADSTSFTSSIEPVPNAING
jgi:hypothetical protein